MKEKETLQAMKLRIEKANNILFTQNESKEVDTLKKTLDHFLMELNETEKAIQSHKNVILIHILIELSFTLLSILIGTTQFICDPFFHNFIPTLIMEFIIVSGSVLIAGDIANKKQKIERIYSDLSNSYKGICEKVVSIDFAKKESQVEETKKIQVHNSSPKITQIEYLNRIKANLSQEYFTDNYQKLKKL